jgi:hypothetical protein
VKYRESHWTLLWIWIILWIEDIILSRFGLNWSIHSPHLLVQATSERFLPAWGTFRAILTSETTGCNQCWYSPFIGGPHQQVWGVYNEQPYEWHVITTLPIYGRWSLFPFTMEKLLSLNSFVITNCAAGHLLIWRNPPHSNPDKAQRTSSKETIFIHEGGWSRRHTATWMKVMGSWRLPQVSPAWPVLKPYFKKSSIIQRSTRIIS